ncbi:MAG: pseudaminic acid cytidylyltransferase [Ignavibacteria bacterium]|jgi:N-acylneuraminate cytidylyltransferase|nr:pseudaminic acid cytidylyltransferase [Ignavibacteria bacterium]MCU7503727.1 pseudaminic acid cytidylyltransferase [Ignavibacteria bacterium]MCU7517627.1 pseudaminic acid cytidylyltransferase [Ignavibacteria bacterium]
MHRTLAIIPARGGSKRIPRKNIREFLGKPIISYSIEAAIKSNIFTEVMVSTDDLEISNISKAYGAQVPFIRSKENSGDYATTASVILEVLKAYQKLGENFDQFCCIYPAAPFVSAEIIKESYHALLMNSADSLVPIGKFCYPIYRALIVQNAKLKFLWPENADARSQDLIVAYHDAGQFYWCDTNSFLLQRKLIMEKTIPLLMDEMDFQDIDNINDWELAELKYKLRESNANKRY